MSIEGKEDLIYDSQIEWIEEEFGKDQEYNLGWGVGIHGCATKIYGKGILDSTYDPDTDEIVHCFTEF